MAALARGVTALAKGLSRVSRRDLGIEILKAVAIFCGLGLLGSIVALLCGADLPGYF